MQPVVTKTLPSPSEYVERARRMEDECDQTTLAALSQAGARAPECIANLNSLLVQMDAVSSCFWCCLGGDHRLEYLAGRIVSSTRASLVLLKRGFYDESFNLTRSIGETANLLFLFAQDSSSYELWISLSQSARRKQFSPVKVRLALETKGLPVPVDEERYSSLSEIATHVSPDTRPNAHMPGQRPKSGGHFNLASSMAALNELAGAFAIASFSIAQLIALPKEIKQGVMVCARDVLTAVGGVSLAALRSNAIATSGTRGPDAL